MLARNGCTVDNRTAVAEGLQLVRQGQPCPRTRYPEAIGIVQVRCNSTDASRLQVLVLSLRFGSQDRVLGMVGSERKSMARSGCLETILRSLQCVPKCTNVRSLPTTVRLFRCQGQTM